MNHLNFIAAILVAMLLASCHDIKENLKDPLSEKDVYKTVGEEIPFETGMKWIEFYKKDRYAQGRLETSSYSVTSAQVKSILNTTENLVGIAFHHAIDDLGQSHIIVIPVDESMSLWSGAPGRIIVDANTESEIGADIAYTWAQRYKDAHPGEIWFHFFGKDIFNDMVALPFFNTAEIEPAINVLELTPELLLVVTDDAVVSSGRTDSDGVVYDASNACPPCAVE